MQIHSLLAAASLLALAAASQADEIINQSARECTQIAEEIGKLDAQERDKFVPGCVADIIDLNYVTNADPATASDAQTGDVKTAHNH